MELSVNSFLQGGKYRIVRYISSGGFGCTYESEHVLLGKRVAIKEFFVKDFCNRDEHTCQVTVGTESKKGLVEKLRKKFIDEARALSRLHHPGIVSVSDVFEENGTAYYVMDYIDGCSLSDLVRREGPLSESRALGYIRQVCSALSYVHAHGRLHLDIKPGNIMIDQEGNAILIDFGASKQYDECGGENTSTLMGRTPGYAPLEQLGNDVVKFLPATDIYAVGATLYKLLTGVTPLSATRLASGESLPPLPDQVSASTRKAVASAMCLNKMQRPQSVEAFLQLLDEPEKRNSNDVAEDEATVFDASIKEPKVVKPKEVHTTENDSVSGNKISRRWLVPIAACLLVCLCVYVFWGRKSGSSGTSDIVRSDTLSVDSVVDDTIILTEDSLSYSSLKARKSSKAMVKVFGYRTQNGGKTWEKIKDDSVYISNVEYVDLGLPSGTKWASCNVGADSPEDPGGYYAYGEVQEKNIYDNSDYIGNKDVDIYGTNKDVATYLLGSHWRMPTSEQCDELRTSCIWSNAMYNGISGNVVTGSNGQSIFIPYGGYYYSGKVYLNNETGYIMNGENIYSNRGIGFANGYLFQHGGQFCVGYNIRPIYIP